jgi:exonuclease SbcD
VKILVTADSQLGKGLDLYPERLAEQEDVWAQTLALALHHGCDAVLHAGDVYEDRKPDDTVRAAFQRPLVGYALPVVAVVGNHDVRRGDLPTAVQLAGVELGGGLLQVSRAPELILVAGAVIATVPWTDLGAMLAVQDGGDRRAVYETAERHLFAIAAALEQQARREHPGLPVVLLGHWAVDCVWPANIDAHEPLLDVDALEAVGFDAVAFGHVHTPFTDGSFCSPGSPMCLSFGEAQDRHGVWILEVEPGGCRWEFVPVESRPFVTLDWDVDAVEATLAVDQRSTRRWTSIVDGAVVRVKYTATEEEARSIDEGQLRKALYAAGAHRVWQIKADVDRQSRARVAAMTTSLSPLAAWDQWWTAQHPDEAPDVRVACRARAARILNEVAA